MAATTPEKRKSATGVTTIGVKRAEDWTRAEVEAEIRKYARAEQDGGEALVDPLVELIVVERQAVLLQFLQEAGGLMQRYELRRRVAQDAVAAFAEQAGVKKLYETRGRVFELPVTVIDDEEEEGAGEKKKDEASAAGDAPAKASSPLTAANLAAAAVAAPTTEKKDGAAAAAEEEDEDSDSTTSSSDSSTPVQPSADAPKPFFLDNAALIAQLETLRMEAKSFTLACVKVQEYLSLSVGSLAAEDTEVAELQAKMVEEFSGAREVANDRYDFYETYLDVRATIEANVTRWPDVQSYKELMAARELSAWEELARSWQLLISSLATLTTTVTQNIGYIVSPDVHVHEVTESSLFM